MSRPARFEEFRFLGDKRTQRVYDLDADDPVQMGAIEELIRSEQFATFGPDTLTEARNRGYRPAPLAPTMATDPVDYVATTGASKRDPS